MGASDFDDTDMTLEEFDSKLGKGEHAHIANLGGSPAVSYESTAETRFERVSLVGNVTLTKKLELAGR